MSVTRSHCDCLVARQNLNFPGAHSSHGKPRAKRMPVIVPGVLGDLRFAERRFKPPAAIRPGAGTREDRVSSLVGYSFILMLECFQSHCVQGNVARATILGLCE